MESFGKALKNVRKSRKKTLRELGTAIGKSIGYISDIEHDRKRPPDLDTVSRIEDFLGVEDGTLMNVARKIRNSVKSSLSQRLKMNPQLSNVLLRADELPEDKRDKAMEDFLGILENYEKEGD